MWLTPIDDESIVAQGKYEVTLGPWTWFGFASEALHDAAEGTRCTCAVNGLDFLEQNLERLGNVSASYFSAQLPAGGNCGTASPPTSSCTTIDPPQPYRTKDSAIEWSGLWSLTAGKTYEWTFRAYWNGVTETFGYPDPGMFVYAAESSDIESLVVEADVSLAAAVQSPPSAIVRDGETIMLGGSQFIEFTDPTGGTTTSTTVFFKPTKTTTVAVFTQHVPSEFMSHVLMDRDTGDYVFPTSLTLYTDTVATSAAISTFKVGTLFSWLMLVVTTAVLRLL